MTVEQQRKSANGGDAADRIKEELQDLLTALANRGIVAVRENLQSLTERLTEYTQNGGGPGLVAALTGAKSLSEGKSPMRALLSAGWAGAKQKISLGRGGQGGKGGGGRGKLKVTNIVESIDVGVPVRLAYNQWTQFTDFPSFMKKVENVDQESEEKLHWKAQIFWSHREWESTILKQVPDEMIIWRSKGAKGSVDGAVTFHEITPTMTRILLVLEYHPQGFFEQTANLWRAQGRRARLELKHYRRHVMSHVLLNPDEVTGWRGVIEDGKVVQDHESRVREEQEAEGGEDRAGDEYQGQEGEDYEDYEGDGRYPEEDSEESEEPYDTEAAYDEDTGEEPPDEPYDEERGYGEEEAYEDEEEPEPEPEPVAQGRRRR